MNPFFVSAVGAFFRWALTIFAVFLVKHGIFTSSEVGGIVEACVVGLLTLSWSLLEKYRSRIKLMVALTKETENEVTEHIKAKLPVPSIFTPSNSIPKLPVPKLPPTGV